MSGTIVMFKRHFKPFIHEVLTEHRDFMIITFGDINFINLYGRIDKKQEFTDRLC